MERKGLKIILFIIIFVSTFSFTKDIFLLNEDRVMQVFSEWELTNIRRKDNLYIDLLDRENDVRIQISKYAKGDTKEKAKERFHKSTTNSGFYKLKNSNNNLSEKYFGVNSTSYERKHRYGLRKKEHILLKEVKFTIEYTGEINDYEMTLTLLKEALDSSEVIKKRVKKTFNKNYSINNYIDKNKFIANAKSNFKNVTFYEIPGNEYDRSEYQIACDENQLGTRAVTVKANNNYSKKVIEGKWENLRKNYQDPYQFRDEEKKITQKYFGVNAKTYTNDYLKRESKLPIIGVIRHIITENFTIVTMTYEIKGNKKQELVEYEAFLKLVKESMK